MISCKLSRFFLTFDIEQNNNCRWFFKQFEQKKMIEASRNSAASTLSLSQRIVSTKPRWKCGFKIWGVYISLGNIHNPKFFIIKQEKYFCTGTFPIQKKFIHFRQSFSKIWNLPSSVCDLSVWGMSWTLWNVTKKIVYILCVNEIVSSTEWNS